MSDDVHARNRAPLDRVREQRRRRMLEALAPLGLLDAELENLADALLATARELTIRLEHVLPIRDTGTTDGPRAVTIRLERPT